MKRSQFHISLYSFSIFFFLFLFSSCSNDLKQVKEVIDKSLLNTEIADTVTILYSKEGELKAKLFTPHFANILTGNPPYIEMNKGLKMIFYAGNLEVQSTLTAKYGKYFEANQNMLVRDSVRIENNKKEVLETEELIWNSKLQKFYTEKFVKVSSPIQVIYGEGLEANQTFSQFKITNVKGVIGVNKNSYPTNL